MANVTLSINDNLLKEGRKYAKKHRTSLNSMIRKMLKQTVETSSQKWLDECFNIMDKVKANSKGKKWKREELYDV